MIKTTPHITIKMFHLEPHNPFSPDENAGEARLIFWLRLVEDSGWGESSTPPSNNFDHGEFIRYWHTAAQPGIPLPQEVDEIAGWVNPDGSNIARSALDMALYDFIGRQQGKPLYQLLNLEKPQPKPTAVNLCMSSAVEMAKNAEAAKKYPILKLRLANDEDEKCLATVRSARPDARIWVDGKAKWSYEEARQKIKMLEDLNIEIMEQPLHADDIEGLGKLQEQTKIHIVADESARSMEQLDSLAKAGVKGINLKLMKIGGISPALKMAHRASELGLSLMLSSTFESSLGTTAMAHLGSLAEWLSLDTPLIISNDPFEGIRYGENGEIIIPDEPGIGVILKQ